MITIHKERNQGVLSGRLYPNDFQILQNLPGRSRWKNRQLYFELSRANGEYLRKHYPDVEWQEGLADQVQAWEDMAKFEEEARMARRKDAGVLDFKYKTQPYKHQDKAFALSRTAKVFALFMEMGTGKTKVAIDTAAYLYASGEINALLIVAPNGVHRQWIEEQIATHLPDWVPRDTLVYLSPSNRRKAWKEEEEAFHEDNGKLKVLAMHVDAFSNKAGVAYAYGLLSRYTVMWTLDESTRIKNSKAARTKAILKLKDLAPFRRILSGAPVTKGVEDLFTQLAFLSSDILGFSSFYTFRNHFCDTMPIPGAPAGAVKIVGYKNIPELTAKLDARSFRVTKAECLDLPEKVYVTREIEMTKEQKHHYEMLRDELYTQLETGQLVEAPLAITKLIKMQQVLCGFLQPEDGPWVALPNNRISETIDILAETRGKTILWANFHADIDRLSEAIRRAGIPCFEYHGRVSREDRDRNIENFKAARDSAVFLGNPASGGTGLNLAEASTMIYYTNSFNADTRWQSEDRIHRIGQTESCTYIDLVIPNTIDTRVLAALRAKKNVATSVMDVRELLQ